MLSQLGLQIGEFAFQTVKRGKGSYIVVMSYYGENKNNSILLDQIPCTPLSYLTFPVPV